MKSKLWLVAALLVTGFGCSTNPFARGPKVDPRFLDYGPTPTGYEATVRTSIESQITAPDVLNDKSVEIGEPKKASYFPPALNAAATAGKPVEYLGWKVEAKFTVSSPSGGVTVNRRTFFINSNEIVAIEKSGSAAIK